MAHSIQYYSNNTQHSNTVLLLYWVDHGPIKVSFWLSKYNEIFLSLGFGMLIRGNASFYSEGKLVDVISFATWQSSRGPPKLVWGTN